MRYLLVHGGGSTARFWDRVVPLLDRPALAVDLPGRGDKPADPATITVDDEVASVLADINAAPFDDPFVVVAHSSGGLVVPGIVAALGDRVERIVLNAALVPPEGGSGLDCLQERHRDGLTAGRELARQQGHVITTAGPPVEVASVEGFRVAYGGEPLDDNELAFVIDPVRCIADTVNHYFQPVHWSLAAGVPVTYLLNEHDRPIPPALQEEMIGRLPSPPEVVRLDCGHLPPVTMPATFADLVQSSSGSA